MERTKKGLIKSIHCNIPSQHRRSPNLRRVVHDVDRREFSRSADVSWVIRVSSAARIGAVREGKFGCEGKRFDRKASRAAEDGLEARRARRGKPGKGPVSKAGVT
jgi:hypothetical protein